MFVLFGVYLRHDSLDGILFIYDCIRAAEFKSNIHMNRNVKCKSLKVEVLTTVQWPFILL